MRGPPRPVESILADLRHFGAADRSTYSLTGTRGSITLDPAYEYAEGLSYALKMRGRERHKEFSKRDQFAAELIYFSERIIRNTRPEPSGEEGLADVRIIEGMLQSIKSGRWVSLRMAQRKQKPAKRQEIHRPAVPREPVLVDAKPASQ